MDRKYILKFFLVAGALLVLPGCGELGLPLGSFTPPTPTLNTLPKFYRANPAVPEQPTVYGTADVSYRLVNWKDLVSVQNGYSQQGYIVLGHCDFAEETGVPLKQNALDYALYLGADLVVYSIQQAPEGQTEHYIDFLAKEPLCGRVRISSL
jgi:hypothetical protein